MNIERLNWLDDFSCPHNRTSRPVVCSNDFEMQRIMSRLRLIWKTIIGLRTQRQIKKNDNTN